MDFNACVGSDEGRDALQCQPTQPTQNDMFAECELTHLVTYFKTTTCADLDDNQKRLKTDVSS